MEFIASEKEPQIHWLFISKLQQKEIGGRKVAFTNTIFSDF